MNRLIDIEWHKGKSGEQADVVAGFPYKPKSKALEEKLHFHFVEYGAHTKQRLVC